ncbi:CPBP family intramembrane glutamic endopeptidase [Microlunatus sp. GCM10028923]|uniref:CPBP family intramembrane glutamic endopeptidase n=1 Tax=Microlunatus sp. GCM10028923 TaxID=3273400 RepID=UPI003606C328
MTETTHQVPETRPAVRPGWPEIVVGLAVMSLVGYGIPILLFRPLGIEGAVSGVLLALLSGTAGMIGFAAAAAIRIRELGPFGVRKTSGKWLLLGLAGGLVALLVKIIVMPALVSAFGLATDTQDTYAAGASAGPLFVILMMLSLAVITPIGEELLFRGVLTTALLRYGPWIGVIGSSVIFALMHGINFVLPAAVIVGLIAGELRRRSGSIWPGVIVHAVNNSITVVVYALIGLSG